MAVNLVNGLVDSNYEPHLCVTRQLGPLKQEVDPEVGFLHLDRNTSFDIRALMNCIAYVKRHNINLIHAHSTSVYFVLLMANFVPELVVLWHVHHGEYTQKNSLCERMIYTWAARKSNGVICVSMKLKEWATILKADNKFVWYMPNFIPTHEAFTSWDTMELPGERSHRVICVSNLRSQKDHITLLKAWKQVAGQIPHSHLLLVGGISEKEYAENVLSMLTEPALIGRVTWMGERSDVPALLKECQIGVLSSSSEGFPVTLLEYGFAELGVVATNVGQCAEILNQGEAGLLVNPGDSSALANALVDLLTDESKRKRLGNRLFKHVSNHFSQKNVLLRLCSIYSELMSK